MKSLLLVAIGGVAGTLVRFGLSIVIPDGCRNLSEDIPRHPDAIEAWMASILG